MMKKMWVVLFALFVLFPAAGWSANWAGLVIQDSTGELITRCVEFSEDSITGEELLKRSGFKIKLNQTDFGAAVCYLHNDGMTEEGACFSHPLGYFWNFFELKNGEWSEAEVGISAYNVSHGNVLGFAFGAWGEVQLPALTGMDLCGYTGQAGLVIDHSDGMRKIVVVEFPGETVTGMQLLQKSGLPLVTSETSFGTAICAIDNEGQESGNCFGDPLFRFWALNLLQDDRWIASWVGAGDLIVRDGDIHGYFFAEYGVPQPSASREEVFGLGSDVKDWIDY